MDTSTRKWIEAVLSNDEWASDAELVTHFMTEGGLSQADAEACVRLREDYLAGRR